MLTDVVHHSWSIALGEYVIAMVAAGRAPSTIRLHRHYLGLLAEQQPRSPWLVTTPQLLAYLAVERWAPETRKSARSTVRVFYRWGQGAGYIDQDPAVLLPPIRVPLGVPRPAPEHLVRQLVRQDSRVGFMAMLAAYAGLRASEISRVHGRDLDRGLTGSAINVVGKGGRGRTVPVVNDALLQRLEAVGDGWAFPNGLGSHLSGGHVCKLLSQAMPDGWTAHKLRHRMATRAYAGTRDLLAVQQLLGHSRPETTQRYVLLPDDATRTAVAATELAS